MVVSAPSRLNEVSHLKERRAELSPKVSQEHLARRAGITLMTYRIAERKTRNIQHSTGEKILVALNEERASRHLPALKLVDLMLMLE